MWSGVLSLGLYILGLSNWLKLFLIKPLPFYWKHASSIPFSRSNTLIYAFIHCFIILIVLFAFACLFIQIFFILVVQSDNICLILIDIYFLIHFFLMLCGCRLHSKLKFMVFRKSEDNVYGKGEHRGTFINQGTSWDIEIRQVKNTYLYIKRFH